MFLPCRRNVYALMDLGKPLFRTRTSIADNADALTPIPLRTSGMDGVGFFDTDFTMVAKHVGCNPIRLEVK